MALLAASSGLAATRAYFVEPKTAANGWTEADPNAYVGQTFVANVDSIAYIEWFVGNLSAEGRYKFELTLDGQSVLEGYESVPAQG